MPSVHRIALIGTHDSIVDRVQELAGRPAVERFADPWTAGLALRTFAPDIILVEATGLDDEAVGALRLLVSLADQAALVLTVPAEHEVEITPLANRLGARILARPFTLGELAAVLSIPATATDPTSPDIFVDLARGIADEINNPLLFAKGYLQLLEDELASGEASDVDDHFRTIRRGLQRIATSVEKLQLLHRVARLQRDDVLPVPIARALGDALRQTIHADTGTVELALADDVVDAEVLGDPRLIAGALVQLCAAGRELAKAAQSAHLTATGTPGTLTIVLDVVGGRLTSWQFPRTYAPYFLNRILRGTQHGLALFLVQAITHAHGGHATARRLEDEQTIRFEIVLPRATADR